MTLPDADEAWEAMWSEMFGLNAPKSSLTGGIFARHRPLIEAAILRGVRERVEGLATHVVFGWEWDCACDGTACVHDDSDDVCVSRNAVLALLTETDAGPEPK